MDFQKPQKTVRQLAVLDLRPVAGAFSQTIAGIRFWSSSYPAKGKEELNNCASFHFPCLSLVGNENEKEEEEEEEGELNPVKPSHTPRGQVHLYLPKRRYQAILESAILGYTRVCWLSLKYTSIHYSMLNIYFMVGKKSSFVDCIDQSAGRF